MKTLLAATFPLLFLSAALGAEESPVSVNPAVLRLLAATGNAATGTVRITFAEGVTGTVTRAHVTDGRLTATLRPLETPRAFEVAVTLPAQAPLGPRRDTLVVETNLPDAKPLTVPLFGTVVPNAWVQPPVVEFRVNPLFPSNLLHRTVILRQSPAGPFTIRSVKWPGSSGTVEFARAPGRTWRLDVRNVLPDASLDGKVIRVETDLPGNGVIEIPLKVPTGPNDIPCAVCRQYGHTAGRHSPASAAAASTNAPPRVQTPAPPPPQP